jgi:hypothetical protein
MPSLLVDCCLRCGGIAVMVCECRNVGGGGAAPLGNGALLDDETRYSFIQVLLL